MIPMRTFLFSAAACLWAGAGAAVAQYNSGATLNTAGSAVGGVPGNGVKIGPGSRQLQDTGGLPGTVTAVSVAPGNTTQVGVCNSSTNTITVSGTFFPQTCIRAVIASASLIASDAGMEVIPAGAGLTITAFNPATATAGNKYMIGSDGVHSFTLATVSGTALFYGCLGSGAGVTSLSVPAGVDVWIVDDESQLPGRYKCTSQGNQAPLSVQQAFTAGQAVTPVALTNASTVAVNAALSNNFTLAISANETLGNPTNLLAGQTVNFWVTQPASGGPFTLAYGTDYQAPGGSSTMTLSSAANAKDLVTCVSDTASTLTCVIVKGIAH